MQDDHKPDSNADNEDSPKDFEEQAMCKKFTLLALLSQSRSTA